MKYASFFDDAFSLSPETGEVLVHISDVSGYLRKYSALQSIAKERISTTFLPSGPLHMLPPQALESLKLSTKECNEVITVALSIDFKTGKVLTTRCFASVIGPVYPLSITTANEIIDGLSIPGIPPAVVKDISSLSLLTDKVCAQDSWMESNVQNKRSTMKSISKDGVLTETSKDHTSAHRIINTLLTLYSNTTYNYIQQLNIPVPLAWENRDKVLTHLPRRFATQPLRNWLAQLQQKQLRAALNMELPLTTQECALAVSHHNSKRQQSAAIIGKDIKTNELQALFDYYNNNKDEAVLLAEGTGKGGTVRILPFNVYGTVTTKNILKGEKLRVKINKLNMDTRTVLLDIA